MNTTDTKNYVSAGKYEAQTVADLRKAAQGKVSNVKGMRKDALITALVEWDAKDAAMAEAAGVQGFSEAQDELEYGARLAALGVPPTPPVEKPAKATARKTRTSTSTKAVKAASVVEKPAAAESAKKVSKRCDICGKRPAASKRANDGIEGMCHPCYEYAGWENTHSDDDHEEYRNGTTTFESDVRDAIDAEIAKCPVCQGNNPADEEVIPSKSPKAHVKSKPMAATRPGQNKAARFADFANEEGWKAHSTTDKGSDTVIATNVDGQTITMVWHTGAYDYALSAHKDVKGSVRRIRNASAARKIVEMA